MTEEPFTDHLLLLTVQQSLDDSSLSASKRVKYEVKDKLLEFENQFINLLNADESNEYGAYEQLLARLEKLVKEKASIKPDNECAEEFLRRIGELKNEYLKPLLENVTFSFDNEFYDNDDKRETSRTVNLLDGKLSVSYIYRGWNDGCSGSETREIVFFTCDEGKSLRLTATWGDKNYKTEFALIFAACKLGDGVSFEDFSDFCDRVMEIVEDISPDVW